jgi:hypothetical protein
LCRYRRIESAAHNTRAAWQLPEPKITQGAIRQRPRPQAWTPGKEVLAAAYPTSIGRAGFHTRYKKFGHISDRKQCRNIQANEGAAAAAFALKLASGRE